MLVPGFGSCSLFVVCVSVGAVPAVQSAVEILHVITAVLVKVSLLWFLCGISYHVTYLADHCVTLAARLALAHGALDIGFGFVSVPVLEHMGAGYDALSTADGRSFVLGVVNV